MAGSDDTATTTSTTGSSDPAVKATLDKLLGGVQSAYDKGPQVFGQALYPGVGGTTQDAWSKAISAANDPTFGQAASGALGGVNGLIGSGGLTSGQQGNIGTVNNAGNGYGALTQNGGLNGTQQGALGTIGNVGAGYGGVAANPLTSGQQSSIGDLSSLLSGYAGVGANGGLTPGMTGAISDLTNVIGNGYGSVAANGGLSTGQAGSLANETGLGGKYAGLSSAFDQNAPGYATMRQKLIDDAVKNVGAGFTQSGRFGGQSYLGDATTDAVNAVAPLDYQNYQNSVANKYKSLDEQQGVNTTAFGMGQTGIGNVLSGLAGRAGADQARIGAEQGGVNNVLASLTGRSQTDAQRFAAEQQGTANKLAGLSGMQGAATDAATLGQQGTNNIMSGLAGQQGAAQSAFGMGQQGTQNLQSLAASLPGLFQSLQMPSSALGQVGGAQDADALAQRQGAADLFTRQANGQTDLLAKLSSILAGNAASAGTTTSSTQPTTPWWQSALGLAIGAL